MGFLDKRKPSNTPVRRVGEVIDVPSAVPPQVPMPPQGRNPNSTGNTYVFVTAPQVQPPSPQPPPQVQYVQQPQTIHHHTTVIQQPRPWRRFRTPGTSSLGSASMSLGLLACMVCWIPTWDIHLAAVPIGALGIVIGLLGFLGAILFRRNGSGLPISGMIVCALAMGIGIEQPILAKFLKGIESAPNTTPTNGSSRAPSNTPILPTPRPSSPGQTGNALVTPAIVAPAPQPTATADAIAAAKADLASAQAKLDADLAGNSAYQTAKTNADAARTNVQNVRATASAGSTELALASQQWIDATNALSEALKAVQATNPAIDADAKAVQKAQAALDALQSPHPPARATPAAQGR